MRAREITNSKTLEAWLTARPRQQIVAVSHRAALRLFPYWGAVMGADWARKSNFTALPVLRSSFMSSVSASVPTANIDDVVASNNLHAAADAAYSAAHAFFSDAALRAAFAGAASVARAAYAADAVFGAQSLKYTMVDCQLLDARQNILRAPLWHKAAPVRFQNAQQAMFEIWDADPPARWDFWRRWWEGAKAGTPIDPALQLAIVQGIDDSTWKDPDETAARIAEIEEQYQLLQDVRAVKAQLTQAQAEVASARHRSHNQPPELIEEAETAAKMITILWEPLAAAEEELERPQPDPSRLNVIGAWLVKAGKEVLAYCGKVADAFTMKAAETLGETGAKWAVRGTFFVVAEKSAGIGQRLSELAEKLLQ